MKMIPNRVRTLLLTLLFCGFSGATCEAQSTLHCLVNGSWFPVYEVKHAQPYCFTGDELVKSSEEDLTMLSSPSFGAGYINVEIIENSRSGVSTEDGMNQFTAERGWYKFSARVTSSQDLEDAYFLMRFDTAGEAAYTCDSIGPLKAGKSRVITILRRLKYEMPKQLHFYSGSTEIRSNLVPANYTYAFGEFMLAASH